MIKEIEIAIKPLRLSEAYKGRRFKTNTYTKWQRDFFFLVGNHEPMKGKISISVDFFIKNDKMSDIDNFFKSLLDTMKDAGIIEDDRNIYEIHARKHHSKNEFIKVILSNI